MKQKLKEWVEKINIWEELFVFFSTMIACIITKTFFNYLNIDYGDFFDFTYLIMFSPIFGYLASELLILISEDLFGDESTNKKKAKFIAIQWRIIIAVFMSTTFNQIFALAFTKIQIIAITFVIQPILNFVIYIFYILLVKVIKCICNIIITCIKFFIGG